jgi:hypothetical protein
MPPKRIRKKYNYIFENKEERAKINKLAREFGFKKVHSEKVAFQKAWNQIIKEMKSKKKLDFIDLDRILGQHGFSLSPNQVRNLMIVIRQTGILDIKEVRDVPRNASNYPKFEIK